MAKVQRSATDEILSRLQTVGKDAARAEKEVSDGVLWLEGCKEHLRGLYALQDSYLEVLEQLALPAPAYELSPRMAV